MRIISKFSDYYDHMMAYGIDTSIVYVRNPVVIDHKDTPFNKPTGRIHKFSEFHIIENHFKLIVCDKVYEGVILYKCDLNSSYFNHTKLKIFYDGAQCKSFLVNYYHKNNKKIYYFYDYEFADGSIASQNVKEFSRKHFAPIILVTKQNVILNPCNLVDYGVQDKIDGMTLFNDIQNWVSTVNVKDMVKLNNDQKIDKAGFDRKISFRHPVK